MASPAASLWYVPNAQQVAKAWARCHRKTTGEEVEVHTESEKIRVSMGEPIDERIRNVFTEMFLDTAGIEIIVEDVVVAPKDKDNLKSIPPLVRFRQLRSEGQQISLINPTYEEIAQATLSNGRFIQIFPKYSERVHPEEVVQAPHVQFITIKYICPAYQTNYSPSIERIAEVDFRKVRTITLEKIEGTEFPVLEQWVAGEDVIDSPSLRLNCLCHCFDDIVITWEDGRETRLPTKDPEEDYYEHHRHTSMLEPPGQIRKIVLPVRKRYLANFRRETFIFVQKKEAASLEKLPGNKESSNCLIL